MLEQCSLKGYMPVFSSLLFKMFGFTLNFSTYHAAVLLHLVRGGSIEAHVFGITCMYIYIYIFHVFYVNNIFIFTGRSSHLHFICTQTCAAAQWSTLDSANTICTAIVFESFDWWLHSSLFSQAQFPEYRPPEPDGLSWCGPAHCSQHQYLNPHRPQLYAEGLRSTWAALQ